jgi:argininosuccinate lyase
MVAMLRVAAGAVAATTLNVERLRRAASDPALLATEAADYLVRRGVPFRQAHEVIGKVVREAEKSGRSWTDIPAEQLKTFSPIFGDDWKKDVTLEAALAGHSLPGGTAPAAVKAAIADCRARLAAQSL